MRILLIFLCIIFAASETNNYFYDALLNLEYQIDTAKFTSNNIPKGNLYFTVPVDNPENISLEIKFLKSDKINFKVEVSGFYQLPTNSEILNGTDYIELEERILITQDDYIVYLFHVPTLKKQAKIKYLVFTILNDEVLNYLSFFSYTYKDEKSEINIYNITYMKEEILNKPTLIEHEGIYFIVFSLENEDLESKKLIRIKINKKYSPEIQAAAAGFKERPTTEKELNNEVSSEHLKLKSSTKDGDYTINEFLLENPEVYKQKYIAIAVEINESIDFMSLYIGPES